MAYGTEYGLVVVDIVQKICLLNIASPDLYGSQDPYARTPRSPKRTETATSRDEQARSPSIDQVCTICSTVFISLYIYIYEFLPLPNTKFKRFSRKTKAIFDKCSFLLKS